MVGGSYRVRFSDPFLEFAIIAAVESYCHGDGKKRRVPAVETLGLVLGHRRKTDDVELIYLDRLATCLSATRAPSSVEPNEKAVRDMKEVMERLAPQLALLGDFHTHPYDTNKCVQAARGYEFSDGDYDAFMADDFLWNCNPAGPVMVLATICRMARVHERSEAADVRWNVKRVDVGEFRISFNVAVGFIA